MKQLKNFVICSSLSVLAVIVSAQTLPDTVFTSQQVVRIAETLDSLEKQNAYYKDLDKVNNQIIESLKTTNSSLNSVVQQYERTLSLQKVQIELLERNLKIYENTLTAGIKKSFWKSPPLWYAAGILTLYISSRVVANVK